MKKEKPIEQTIRETVAKSKKMAFVKIPDTNYHAMTDFISHSMLRGMRSTPSKFMWNMKNPRPASTAQELGTAIHMALLEPERFASHYAIQPKVDRRTKEGKAAAEAWTQQNAGKVALSDYDNDVVEKILARVNLKPKLKQFFEKGQAEASFFAIDEESGLGLRCRTDYFIEGLNVIVDLKTTDCAETRVFLKDITDYGYNTQAAFYMDVVEMATGKRPDAFVIIAAEKSKDCDVQKFTLTQKALEDGRVIYRYWLNTLKQCQAKQEWPGYKDEFIAYNTPQWLVEAIERGDFSI